MVHKKLGGPEISEIKKLVKGLVVTENGSKYSPNRRDQRMPRV